MNISHLLYQFFGAFTMRRYIFTERERNPLARRFRVDEVEGVDGRGGRLWVVTTHKGFRGGPLVRSYMFTDGERTRLRRCLEAEELL